MGCQIIIFLHLLLVSQGVAGQNTCESCMGYKGQIKPCVIQTIFLTDALHTRLVSNTSLATKNTVLVAKLCPTTANQTQCQEYLDQFWDNIVKATFSIFLDLVDTCKGEELCKTNLTCNEYMTEIVKMETHGTKYYEVVELLEVSNNIKYILCNDPLSG